MKKPRTQSAFATLTEAELNQLADWLRHETYDTIRVRLRKPRAEGGFDLTISRSPLERLYAKVAILDLINAKVPADKKLTLTQFLTIWAGHLPSDIAAPNQVLREAPDFNEKCKMLNALPEGAFKSQCSMNEPARSPLPPNSPAITEIHTAILSTVHDLATSSDNTPTNLMNLQRLADFPARAEIRQHRLDLDRQKLTHKREMDTFRKEIAAARLDLTKQNFAFRQKQHEDRLTLARERASFAPTSNFTPRASNLSDPLGPAARNWDEVSERARINFDVSKEEWSRRQSLHHAPTPNLNPTLFPSPAAASRQSAPSTKTDSTEADEPQTITAISSPSAENPSLVPASLASAKSQTDLTAGAPDALINTQLQLGDPATDDSSRRFNAFSEPTSNFAPRPSDLTSAVHGYTSRRAEEYWAWRRAAAALPDGQSPPPYTTELRHCPCGKPCPCPEHENETFGEFPKFFWSTAPHFRVYALCLTDRNLPYRDRYEQIPEQFRIYDKKRSRYD